MKKNKNLLSVIILVISFILLFTFLFTRIQGKTPELFGYQLLRISSSSMEPKLKVGNVILSKSVDDVSKLEEGDIITYEGEVGGYAGKLITHQVTVEPYQYADEYYLQTMGIANGYNDPEISESQVVGKMVCKVPFLGFIYNLFITPWGLVIILVFLAFLFISEIINLRRLLKEKKNLNETESDDQENKDKSVDDQ